jgi:hypothetical protein
MFECEQLDSVDTSDMGTIRRRNSMYSEDDDLTPGGGDAGDGPPDLMLDVHGNAPRLRPIGLKIDTSELQRPSLAPSGENAVPIRMPITEVGSSSAAIDKAAPAPTGFLSLFGWIAAPSGGDTGGDGSNERNGGGIGGLQPSSRVEPDSVNRSAQSAMAPSKDIVVVPQVLEAILRVLQEAESPECIKKTFDTLSAAVSPATVSAVPANSEAEQKESSGNNELDFDVICRNVESICSQRDWLLWLCDTYLVLHRRVVHDRLRDGNPTSMSESDSVAGGDVSGYDTEDSTDGPGQFRGGRSNRGGGSAIMMADRARSLSPAVARRARHTPADASSPHIMESPRTRVLAAAQRKQHIMEMFVGPIFSFLQLIFVADMRCKSVASRHIFDIVSRIPMEIPEAKQFQQNLLFDVLDAAASLPFVSIETSLNVLRNISSLLEQVAEKLDIGIEFCVQAVDTANSISYNCPTVIRPKIKETSLPDMRVLYVTRCLIDSSVEIDVKAAAIRDIHASILSLITSGETKSGLQDSQVLVILLGMVIDAADEIERALEVVAQGSSALGGADAVGSLDSLSNRGKQQGTSAAALNAAALMETDVARLIVDDAWDRVSLMTEVQSVAIEVIQDLMGASSECRKYCQQKLFAGLDSALHPVHVQHGVVESSLPNGLSRGDVWRAALSNKFGIDKVTLADLQSLDSAGDRMGDSVAGGALSTSPSSLAGSPGTHSATVNVSQLAGSPPQASQPLGSSWWGSWTSSQQSAAGQTAGIVKHTSVPPLKLPASMDSTLMQPAQTSGLSEMLRGSNGSVTAAAPPAAHIDNAAFLYWMAKFSNKDLRIELKNRILKELKPILRQSEKIQVIFTVIYFVVSYLHLTLIIGTSCSEES